MAINLKKISFNQFYPIIYLTPLFAIFLSVFYFLGTNELIDSGGDGWKYIQFAENLLNGFYADKSGEIGFLWYGPGYPFLLSFLIFFKSSFFSIKLFNCILYILASIILFSAYKISFSPKTAIFFTYLTCLVHPYFRIAISTIMSEAFSFFCVTCLLYIYLKIIKKQSFKFILLFSLIGCWLVLTKVFFAYVFIAAFFISILFIRKNILFLKLSLFPLIFCIPYLVYTFNLTSKIFYWTDSGGNNLYCMSTPYNDEVGEWFYTGADGFENLKDDKYVSNIYYNHKDFFNTIKMLSVNGVEYDQALKKKAIQNIVSYPNKYLKNITFNVSRLFTNFPRVIGHEFSIFKIPNIFLFVLIFWLLILSSYDVLILNPNINNTPILIFTLIFIFGFSLVAAYQRYLFPIIPLIIYIISPTILKLNKTFQNP